MTNSMTTEPPTQRAPRFPDGFWTALKDRRLGLRARMLGTSVALLVGATLVGIVIQRAVLLQRHVDDVATMLEQERLELEKLASGTNPTTGQPFNDDVVAIFDTFLSRNVPGPGEVFVTFVDGSPYARTPAPIALDEQPELVERWGRLATGERGEIMTDEGLVYYLAIPLLGPAATPADGSSPAVPAADAAAPSGEATPKGVFVSAIFVDEERNRISGDLRIQGLVTAAVIAAAVLISWITAGRLLRPLRSVTDTARTISEHDLSQRIPVENDDEVGELAETFNQMLDRLEQSFASQRSFIDDAGHELRTPITIIMGQLELMGDSAEDREQTLAVVNDELARMARIVEDLLLLAKAEQANFITREPVEVSELTADLFVKARTLGERAWVFDGTATGTAELDQQRLHQAVLNLARNAVEHTDAGTEVGIGSEIVDGSLRLWVRDHGPGIAAEDQQRIFERFSRGRGARRRSDGAGLGLAIVSAVASGHGGTVTLDSAIGLGSKFTIVIPLGAHPTNAHPTEPDALDGDPLMTEPAATPSGAGRKDDDAPHPHR